MSSYSIKVQRSGASNGTLTFSVDNRVVFTTPCWEDADKRIPAKTYTGCSATLMASKGYQAVYLPDDQTGRRGIFVHQGTSPNWSEGCIVCAPDKMRKIYETVPHNCHNVTVTVV